LYDPTISRLAVSAMRNLHPESVANIESKALFSIAEEELLATIQSVCSVFSFSLGDLLIYYVLLRTHNPPSKPFKTCSPKIQTYSIEDAQLKVLCVIGNK